MSISNGSIYKASILQGKVALVTGGATGIGRGIAECLAQVGADIVIASRNEERCQQAAEQLAAKHGVRSSGYGLDVRKSSEVKQVFAQAQREMGRLDILVNNAAGNFYFPAEKLRDSLWQAVLEIDLYGAFYCSRAAFSSMREGGGSIINISSNLQKDGWIGMAPAASAKAGIDALTKTLAKEWARFNIRVNAIAPGPIVTEGVTKAFEAGGSFSSENLLRTVPLGRSGKPEEIGNLAVYMASEAASWMTGSIVVLDGGEAISHLRGQPDPAQLEQQLKERRRKK